MTTKPQIMICGGGTGGHVFPGLAVADALCALADVDVTFVGTERGIETRVIPPRGYALELLNVEPMKGGGFARAVRGGAIAAMAISSAISVIRRVKPRVVMSMGGYAAGPVSLAAAALGVPLTLLEPNSTLGLANRILAPVCKRAFVSWQETANTIGVQKCRMFGVPLRSGFAPRDDAQNAVKRILVMGGSQGAKAINDRMPGAIARALKSLPGLSVLHQTGKDRDNEVAKSYLEHGVEAATVVPFVENVADEIRAADLVIARAGAVTVAEICAIGRPSILIPFPHAADDHQAKNAIALADLGGTLAIRQEAADDVRIGSEIVRILSDDSFRTQMAEAARRHGKPNAASDVAEELLHLANLPVTRPRDRETNSPRAEAI